MLGRLVGGEAAGRLARMPNQDCVSPIIRHNPLTVLRVSTQSSQIRERGQYTARESLLTWSVAQNPNQKELRLKIDFINVPRSIPLVESQPPHSVVTMSAPYDYHFCKLTNNSKNIRILIIEKNESEVLEAQLQQLD